jgi:hypothetical protein
MSKAILVVGGVISGGSKVRMAFKKLHGAATSYLRPVTDRENLTVVTTAWPRGSRSGPSCKSRGHPDNHHQRGEITTRGRHGHGRRLGGGC